MKKKPRKQRQSESEALRTDALDEAFGLWRNVKMDGLEYQRKFRAEWEPDSQPADLHTSSVKKRGE